MRPSKEQVLASGEVKEEPWPPEKSRAKLEEIRAGKQQFLRERNRKIAVETGHDYLIREDGLIRLTHVVDGKIERIFKDGVNPETGQDYLPKSQKLKDFWGNPAPLVYSGAELTAMVIEAWHEFCSKPRDDKLVPVPIRHKAKYLRNGSPPQFASEVVEKPVANEGGSTRDAFLSDKPKRKRGRPRKSEVQAVGQLPDSSGA